MILLRHGRYDSRLSSTRRRVAPAGTDSYKIERILAAKSAGRLSATRPGRLARLVSNSDEDAPARLQGLPGLLPGRTQLRVQRPSPELKEQPWLRWAALLLPPR